MIKKCFFWGATGQSMVLKEFIGDFKYKLCWLFDNDEGISEKVGGVSVIGGWNKFLEWAMKKQSKNIFFLIAIGGDKGKERLDLQNKICDIGFHPLTIWHRTAFIAEGVQIGEGSQILANTSISVGVKIGKACIVNTGSQIDHECVIEDGVHIMPGAILTGCVHVEKFVTIGSGAIILPRLRIGSGSFIGAGAVIIRDVPSHSVVVGNPGKIIKQI